MKRGLKLAGITLGLVGLTLWGLGLALRGTVVQRSEAKLAAMLGGTAEVHVASAAVNLLNGRVQLRGIKGQSREAALTVDAVGVEVWPLGVSLLTGELQRLHVHGLRLELTAAPLISAQRQAMAVRRTTITDAVITMRPLRWLPRVGNWELQLARVEVGPVEMYSTWSWVFAITSLEAQLTLLGQAYKVHYAPGRLRLEGGLLGEAPLEIPLDLAELRNTDPLAGLETLGKRLVKEILQRSGQANGDVTEASP